MNRRQLIPNTTLFPVPVVLITCGHSPGNVFTLNRISSCNAEPPMLAISVRPARHSHDLIRETNEFVVNIPGPEMALVTDYVGVTTGRQEDKWLAKHLSPIPASIVNAPLIAECPVNLECRVIQTIDLPSHTMFIGEVVAFHALDSILNEREEIELSQFQGMTYGVSVVRERPVKDLNVDELRRSVGWNE